MKKIGILILTFFFSAAVSAQIMILHDPVSGKTFSSEKYSGIKGSPFLYDKWIQGSVTTSKGIYQDLQLKLDAYSNTLYFNKDDQTHEIQDKVKKFTLIRDVADTLYFINGISGASLKPEQFVQVLTEGQVSLYKSDIKLLSELNEINAGIVKSFANSTRYFMMKDGDLQLIKLNKKEVFNVLKDKQGEVEAYINDNKLSTKKESDFIQILEYYNSLNIKR